MKHKILALFCSIIISIPCLAAPITDKEVIDSVNNFFEALNVKNYGNGKLEESVTDDFLIFELADSYTLDEFKNFIENALYKDDFKDFKIPENIYLTSLNYDTGLKSAPGDKNIIIEALKIGDINNIDNNNLISINGRDTLVKFRQFY